MKYLREISFILSLTTEMVPSDLRITQKFPCGLPYLSVVAVVERDGHAWLKSMCLPKVSAKNEPSLTLEISSGNCQAMSLFSLFSCFEFRNYALNVLHADGKTLQGEIC